MLATNASLSIRVDALTDADGKSEPSAPTIGLENRAILESRLRALQHQEDLTGVRGFGVSPQKQQKYTPAAETKTYNTAADAVDLVSTQRDPLEKALQAVNDAKEEKRKAKEEKKAKKRAEKAFVAFEVLATVSVFAAIVFFDLLLFRVVAVSMRASTLLCLHKTSLFVSFARQARLVTQADGAVQPALDDAVPAFADKQEPIEPPCWEVVVIGAPDVQSVVRHDWF